MNAAPTRRWTSDPRAARSLYVLDVCSLARVTMLAMVVEIAVRLLPLPTVARLMRVSLVQPPARPGVATLPDLRPAERRAVRMARALMRRWPWGRGACLRRSLLVGHVLRRHDPWLRVGVARDDTDIRAHAWLEIRGVEATGAGPFLAFEMP
jgi:Transglutaminase-like superfamily